MKNDTEQSMAPSHKYDHSMELAQLELFIRLGNMLDLDPNKHFGGILHLGNALIQGDIASLQRALAFYVDHSDLIFEHISYLKRAFAPAGVSFQEPAILRYEGQLGQTKTAIVIAILLERACKVAFISSDPCMASYVHAFTRNQYGTMTMEPLKEDPQLLLKQISRIIRLPDVTGPPPFSTALSY